MTLLKKMLMGAALAASLIGTVGQAKADVVRVNGAPPRVEYVQPRPRVEYVQPRPRLEYVQPRRVEYVQPRPRVEYVPRARRSVWERRHRAYREVVAPTVVVPAPSHGHVPCDTRGPVSY